MKCIEITDELLFKYMPVVDQELIQELEEQVDKNWEFSSEFERKMNCLIKEEAHPYSTKIQIILKRIAIIFLVIIGISFAFTMSVEAYRLKFFDTVFRVYEDSILVSFFTEEENAKFNLTEPTYIPEGYEEVRRIENDISTIIIYENAYGEQIIWEQQLVENEGSIYIDSEYDVMEVKEVNGMTVTIYSYLDGYAIAYYEFGDYVYLITADKLDGEMLYQLIDSMRN